MSNRVGIEYYCSPIVVTSINHIEALYQTEKQVLALGLIHRQLSVYKPKGMVNYSEQSVFFVNDIFTSCD